MENEKKEYKALVVDRRDVALTVFNMEPMRARWIKFTASNRNNAYSKINRMANVIIIMFEVGSDKERKLKAGLFKDFKEVHQVNNFSKNK